MTASAAQTSPVVSSPRGLAQNALAGANVILFDDIVTTGRAVQRIKTELENLGANVLFFISVAKTELNNPG